MNVDLSVVIPVYNEAENLGPLQGELTAALGRIARPYELVYVDDGSSDSSHGVLDRLQREDPHVSVVRLARNYGQTAAMAAGFDHARGEIIVTLDADLQNDPADIATMLAKLDEGYDLVSGWRLPRQDPWLTRRVPSVIANSIIGWITGVHLHDYGCTLKVIRRDVVRGLRLYGEMHRFIPALADDLGAKLAEVVVHHRPRRFGVSKYGLSRTIRVLLDLITVKFLSSYSTRPIQVFGVLGLLSSSIGLVITGWLGLERLFLGVPLANRPLVWLGILLTLMGLQFITMGLLGELLVRTYHESQGKPVYRVAEVLRTT
ncbi:MAG TPA: glycosyltransferase family 2 protein [Candidatus Acidoferrales bacterium]|nr:glycosyltransferase family 2 protein [Candidatus Acidoferrales bacterium]